MTTAEISRYGHREVNCKLVVKSLPIHASFLVKSIGHSQFRKLVKNHKLVKRLGRNTLKFWAKIKKKDGKWRLPRNLSIWKPLSRFLGRRHFRKLQLPWRWNFRPTRYITIFLRWIQRLQICKISTDVRGTLKACRYQYGPQTGNGTLSTCFVYINH